MDFDNVTYRNPKDVTNQWSIYFKNLYTCNPNSNAYQPAINHVNEWVNRVRSESCLRVEDRFNIEDNSKSVLRLNKNKACSQDSIFNEHITYGGKTLHKCLLKLYNSMFKCSFVPKMLKYGLIVTLFKGENKSKTDPNNYRAITLSSAVLKLYEALLPESVKSEIKVQPSSLQFGFQSGVSCSITSILFKECLYYTRESHSKLYTCFLDIQKAFDRVWQNGLCYKLHEIGVTVNTLKSSISIYDDTKCSVLFHGYTSRSELFSVEIGTWQGGLSSPFFYLCYINGLLCKLEKCNYGLNLGNIHLPCITSADGMVPLSLSKKGLDRMLDIGHAYSRKLLFEYN